MPRTASRTVRSLTAAALGMVLLAGSATVATAQESAATQSSESAAQLAVRSSQIAISRNEAVLQLELTGERALTLALRDGRAFVDGTEIGSAPRGGQLDRAWRELLDQAMETPNAELAALLEGWDAPAADGVGTRLDRAMEAVLGGHALDTVLAELADAAVMADNAVAQGSDSVTRLLDRIQELETVVEQLEGRPVQVEVTSGRRGSRSRGPLDNVVDAVQGIIGLLVAMAIVIGIGFAVIFFGGRTYLEGVADTARRMTVRSLLVGIAGSFLVLPAFILGIIALVISIVGIPGLLVWVPGFPLAVAVAILLGYLGAAHAAGEAMAEYRFRGSEWFQHANSYYFLASGVGVLMALFFAAQVAHMAGWILSFIEGLLIFFGVALTWAALSVGLGAVLISRGGTRPLGRDPVPEEGLFSEDNHV